MLGNRSSHCERARINVRSLANVAAARYEERNGRQIVIVPSATLPDDIVMNGIKYPASEIGKSYASLNRTPAPLGHPMIGNSFVSARDPEGINIGYIGAWNENARRESGRVFLDKVIDIEVANRSEGGKRVLSAIKKGEPIHTSTGLVCDLDPAEEGAGHDFVALNIEFDHDAILLDEEGAATPAQGVGMMVNGKAVEMRVVNSAVETADREMDWAADHLLQAYERAQRAPKVEQLKAFLAGLFNMGQEHTANGQKEEDMAVSDEDFKKLAASVATIGTALDKIGETVANAVDEKLKPLNDSVAAITANQKAADEAKRAGLVNKLVETGQWEADDLKDIPTPALEKMADKVKPGKASALNGAGFDPGQGDDPFAGYDPNAAFGEEDAKK